LPGGYKEPHSEMIVVAGWGRMKARATRIVTNSEEKLTKLKAHLTITVPPSIRPCTNLCASTSALILSIFMSKARYTYPTSFARSWGHRGSAFLKSRIVTDIDNFFLVFFWQISRVDDIS